MTDLTKDITEMLEILPTEEKYFAYEFIKRLVLAWDPDFTRVTNAEAVQIKQAEASGFVNESEINWETVGIED